MPEATLSACAAHGVAAELLAQGGEELGAKGAFLPGTEPLLEGSGNRGDWHGKVDGLLDSPATLAGVLDEGLEAFKARVLAEGGGGKVEEPGANDGAMAPSFGNGG